MCVVDSPANKPPRLKQRTMGAVTKHMGTEAGVELLLVSMLARTH